MKISIRKHLQLVFALYIRKYRKDKFNELALGLYNENEIKYLNDEQIQDIVNRMDRKDIHVYVIDYLSDIFDDIEDFINQIDYYINRECIYNKLHKDIIKSNKSSDEKIEELEELDACNFNYSLICLRNNIPFYLQNTELIGDVDVIVEIGDKLMLTFYSDQNDHVEFYIDFMITSFNNNET